ncbi:putative immunity protein [Bosea sp. RAF48]|uniref:putative immunity protein n=1 Tax=Bosea sp. RAF48 TaxID=3237480 RepID=UPI003F93B3C0
MIPNLSAVELSLLDLREVTGYAISCALPALEIFEHAYSNDKRPRLAIEAAAEFVDGAKRSAALRNSAWGAQRAANRARQDGLLAATSAARGAMAAAGAAFLHPLPMSTQVKHILGAASYAAHAFEMSSGGNPAAGFEAIRTACTLASPATITVLRRYPAPPPGGGRVGELIRELDRLLRER